LGLTYSKLKDFEVFLENYADRIAGRTSYRISWTKRK